MRITDAKVIVCSPGRNFVTLKISTEDGIYGLGDATLNGRELAVASYLTDHGGSANVESSTTSGTTVLIKLPRAEQPVAGYSQANVA